MTLPPQSAYDVDPPMPLGLPRDPHEAVARLSAEQHVQVSSHRHLDAAETWRQPADLLLGQARAQLAELEHLLAQSPLEQAPRVLARRLRTTCANAANYLAFLAAQADTGAA